MSVELQATYYLATNWVPSSLEHESPSTPPMNFRIGAGLSVLRSEREEHPQRFIQHLAGSPANSDELQIHTTSVYCEYEAFAPDADVVVARWIESQRDRYETWDGELEAALVDALEVEEHLHKPVNILSRGTKQKVELVGAFAAGADVALLVTPFAGLDAPSRRVVSEIFEDAAEHPRRAWVIADLDWAPEFDRMGAVHFINFD